MFQMDYSETEIQTLRTVPDSNSWLIPNSETPSKRELAMANTLFFRLA